MDDAMTTDATVTSDEEEDSLGRSGCETPSFVMDADHESVFGEESSDVAVMATATEDNIWNCFWPQYN